MNRKRIIIALMGIAFLSFDINAQSRDNKVDQKEQNVLSSEERAERKADRMTKELNLTQEQRRRLKELSKNSYDQRQVERQRRKQKFRERRKHHDAALRDILTEKQFKAHKENNRLRKQKRKARKKRNFKHRMEKQKKQFRNQGDF